MNHQSFFLSFLLAAALFIAACTGGGSSMSREIYDDITIGTSMQEVTQKAGEPYSARSLGNDKDEYQYIERVSIGNEMFYVNHYYFEVTDGIVVGKRLKQETRPGFDLLYQEDPNYESYP